MKEITRDDCVAILKILIRSDTYDYSLRTIAAEIGVRFQRVSDWINDKVKPTYDNYLKIREFIVKNNYQNLI